MASDWWSRKLSNPQPTVQQRPVSSPPSGAPVRVGHQVNFPSTQPVPQAEKVLDEQLPPNAEIHMSDAIRMWKGGEAARKEGNMYCPECGSQHVFSRTARGGNTLIQGKSPAPRCFECGWTGLYTQGMESNWA